MRFNDLLTLPLNVENTIHSDCCFVRTQLMTTHEIRLSMFMLLFVVFFFLLIFGTLTSDVLNKFYSKNTNSKCENNYFCLKCTDSSKNLSMKSKTRCAPFETKETRMRCKLEFEQSSIQTAIWVYRSFWSSRLLFLVRIDPSTFTDLTHSKMRLCLRH